jgi:hypothetical protein
MVIPRTRVGRPEFGVVLGRKRNLRIKAWWTHSSTLSTHSWQGEKTKRTPEE